MMRKLRTLLVALLLVPALFSNASAFTTQSDGALSLPRPPANTCYWWYNGFPIPYPC